METKIWNKRLPVNTSKYEHYASFGDTLLESHPTSIAVSPDMLPILVLNRGWAHSQEPIPEIGSRICGTLKGIPVLLDSGLESSAILTGNNFKELIYKVVCEEN